MFRSRKRDESTPEQWVERRTPVRWCAACRRANGPFIYLENGKHYCRPCAVEAYEVMRLRPAGRRADDLKSA